MRDNDGMLRAPSSGTTTSVFHSVRLRNALFFVLALAWAVPVVYHAHDRVLQVRQQARAQLIMLHRLWELHPEYRGTAENWTRFASRLLTDRQLMLRVASKYGALSEQIELEYRRDLTIAEGEVFLVALAIWALPLGVLYALGHALRRRAPAQAPVRVKASSASDPRYLPASSADNNKSP